MSQEPLEYFPPERWNELQSAFKRDWPRGISGFQVLDSQLRWMKKGIKYDLKVYCPFGDVKNGMVAVNEKDTSYEIIIQCPSDDTEDLLTALRTTKLIDWKKSVLIPYAPQNVIDCVQKLVEDVGMVMGTLGSETFLLDRKTPYEDVDLPPNMTFDLLKEDCVDLLDSTWPHRYSSSSSYFKKLIDIKHGYGLYLNYTLISWALINESGNLTHMYTVEEHRKKGYAELVLKLVCNIMIEEGRYVPAYCLKDNYNAIKLYTKAGFDRCDNVAWCFLRSKTK